jgi:hypothetical protein
MRVATCFGLARSKRVAVLKNIEVLIVSMVVFIISFIILRHALGCIALTFVKSVGSEVLLAVTRRFG